MGSLDWEVSALGFGAMRLPTNRGFLMRAVDGMEAVRIIRHGIDLGINIPTELEKVHAIVGQRRPIAEHYPTSGSDQRAEAGPSRKGQ
jgi:hypothetical protein